jgi:hypothetical protein
MLRLGAATPISSETKHVTLRELVYDLLDEGRRDGDFSLDRDSIDLIAAGIQDTLNDREDVRGPFDHDELADMVDDWFDARRIDEDGTGQ